MITAETLHKFAPKLKNPESHESALEDARKTSSVTTPRRLCHFMGQIFVETGGFASMVGLGFTITRELAMALAAAARTLESIRGLLTRVNAFAIVVAALAIGPALEARAQPATGDDLTRALFELREAVEKLPPNLRAQPTVRFQRLDAASQWLHKNRGKAVGVSEEYVRSIRRAAELLRKQPTAEVVEDVTSELETKVDHCRRLGLGMGGTVVLTVNTRRGPGTVSDWQVLYLLKIYERVTGTSPGNFPRLSTPTEMLLEPGRYWVWARDPATGRTSERALVRVAGRKEIVVDLPVP